MANLPDPDRSDRRLLKVGPDCENARRHSSRHCARIWHIQYQSSERLGSSWFVLQQHPVLTLTLFSHSNIILFKGTRLLQRLLKCIFILPCYQPSVQLYTHMDHQRSLAISLQLQLGLIELARGTNGHPLSTMLVV